MLKQLAAVLLLAFVPIALGGEAEELIEASGKSGGFVVHVPCGDGTLTAGLRAGDGFVVQGLDADVAAARRNIRAAGVYGSVSAVPWEGGALPYAENLVNLLVVSDPACELPEGETDRVLAPLGVMMRRRADGTWAKSVKPWPDEIDEWTHWLHGADNNAVAADTLAGSPRRIHWVAEPRWGRSHENDRSVPAVVSARGRLFAIIDEAPVGFASQSGVPHDWQLVARDAFSGVLLWKRPIADMPSTGVWRLEELGRLLVAVGDRVYVKPSAASPVLSIDAASGDTVLSFENTERAAELLVDEQGLLVISPAARRQPLPGGAKLSAITAYDVETGAVEWSADELGVMPMTAASSGGRIFFFTGGKMACLDRDDGALQWESSPMEKNSVANVVALPDAVLFGSNTRIGALNAAGGQPLWTKEFNQRGGAGIAFETMFGGGRHLFVMNGLLNNSWDPLTGEERRPLPEAPSCLLSDGHHYRCYRDRATDRFMYIAKRGLEVYDTIGDDHSRNDWTRGMCRVGVMPCNGLLYVPPHYCFCYPGAKLNGFFAYAAGPEPPAAQPADADRLERGPAYGDVAGPADDDATGWPMYRRDPARSGSTPTGVGAALERAWQVDIGGRLTQPVVAGGRLYVAQVDAHTVHAFDLPDGDPAWSFTADGRIDSAPTVDGPRVLFGSADGFVYCLRARDGALAWRFRAARDASTILAHEQPESPWPVGGSVLVRDGLVYAAAGRSSFLDGGIDLYALDPATGQLVHHAALEGPYPDLEKDTGNGFYMDGAVADLLVSGVGKSGEFIYLQHRKFDRSLVEQPVEYVTGIGGKEGVNYTGETEKVKVPVAVGQGDKETGLHLMSTSGLRDDSYMDRTGWLFARTWPGYNHVNVAPKSGQILCFDGELTVAMQAFTQRLRRSPLRVEGEDGYAIVADAVDNEPVLRPEHRNLDKAGPGFTRAADPRWKTVLPVRVRAMVMAGDAVVMAGPPEARPGEDVLETLRGRKGAVMVVLARADGAKLAEHVLASPPVFDGMSSSGGAVFIAHTDGKVTCWR